MNHTIYTPLPVLHVKLALHARARLDANESRLLRAAAECGSLADLGPPVGEHLLLSDGYFGRLSRVATEVELAELLNTYSEAMAAHQRLMSALIDAMIKDQPTADIAADERHAHIELIEARRALLHALTDV